MQDIAIYLHFPFCLSKCNYCAFYSVIFNSELYFDVIKKMLSDIKASRTLYGERHVVSIFFGGGTPSLMRPDDIKKIIDEIALHHHISDNVEITLESNPDTLNKENISQFKLAGINRISLGCQSFLDCELNFLGRRCSAENTINAMLLVKDQFSNFNLDLIYGFPVQTLDSLKYSLEKALSISPPHISCYKLTFEQNTILYNKLKSGQITDISDQLDANLFLEINNILVNNGLHRYEISNFAKKGFECLHNYMYWNYNDYLGIGAGAHSRFTIDDVKYSIANPCNITQWLKIGTPIMEALTTSEVCEEAIIMGLRTTNGVCDKYFKHLSNQHNYDMLLRKKILKKIGDRIIINKKYLNVCDHITDMLINS